MKQQLRTQNNETYFDLDDIEQVIAWDYLRVSQDRSGVTRSNTEQHGENGELCTRKRWHLAGSYTDTGSASEFQTKRRAGFDKLMDDLRRDTFAGHVLIVWEVSRGTRQPGEMETLLALCQQRGVWLYVFNKRRLFNPTVVDDWEDLMHAVVSAAGEVMRTSQRVRRAHSADADAGRWKGGRRPFGFTADGVEHVPAEAKVIREAVDRVLRGESVRAIAADLNRRGVTTSTGKRWHPGPLTNLLRSARIAGQRVHHGEVVGVGEWEPIIDLSTHRRLVAVLAARTPVGRRGRTPWPLTGFLRCGRCGASLVGNIDAAGGTRRYICRKAPGYNGCGGLGIKATDLEATLGDLITERLANLDARRGADTGPGDDDELAELTEIAVELDEAVQDRAKGIRGGGIDRATFNMLAAALHERRTEVERRLAAKVHEARPLDLLLSDDGSHGRSWDECDTERKRLMLGALIEHVTVAPASVRGSTKFEAERVTSGGRIAWKV